MSDLALPKSRRPFLTPPAAPRVAAVCALVLGLVLTLLSPATAGAAATPVDTAGLAGEFAAQLNAERAARGLNPLVLDAGLTGDAQQWSNELARSRDLEHSPQQNIEIVARGQRTGQITDAWMRSASHRHLIVDPNLGFAGVGVKCDSNGQIWATVQFRRIDSRLGTLRSSATSPRVTPSGEGSSCSDQPVANAVRRLYRAYFKRESDAGGLSFWVQSVSAGVRLGHISDQFASSPEFVDTYGSLSDRAFLDLVYRNVMGRTPDQAGYDFWLNELRSGLSRGDLMLGFSDAPEFRDATGLR